jgi:archaellum biogenesis ATPase FlaH
MIEQLILSHLLYNEEFARKSLPFLKIEYFQELADQTVFDIIQTHVKTYNSFPTKESCYIDLSNRNGINEETFKKSKEVIRDLEVTEKTDLKWILEKTEKWCQDSAVYNAIRTSISILDDKTGQLNKGVIPKLLSDALAVSFDSSVGHDFLNDYALRYELYHSKEARIPFDIDLLNLITKGGLPKKTFNVFMAGTGVGKTLFLAHFAANNLMKGLNVLYVTMEMAEERIAERIDANILNIQINQLDTLTRDGYFSKFDKLKRREPAPGRLIIKEYPTASASATTFRYLLNELKIKKNFVPDIIYIDYINICASARLKMGSNVNTYSYVKAIAEELRGLAVEFELPIVSATQSNRTGITNSDPGLENTSDSIGLPMTVDFMVALVTSEELEKRNQIIVKQLKNRYSDLAQKRRFVIGVDKPKMRLYNCEESAQKELIEEDVPVMDKTDFGISLSAEKFTPQLFKDFK